MSPRKAKRSVRIVLSYAHSDREKLDLSKLLDFIRDLAVDKKWEFWWDQDLIHPLFDEEIRGRFEEADAIICIVSQNFLGSKYIKKVESAIARKRGKREGILVLPVLLTASLWENHAWLRKLHHFPTDGSFLHGSGNRKYAINLQISTYISNHFGNKVSALSDPKMIYRLRHLPETGLSRKWVRSLANDSCERARAAVPEAKLRERICAEAKRRLKMKPNEHLSKEELAEIDRKFLAGTRKPDPKNVRWVLRCAGLHPQGK